MRAIQLILLAAVSAVVALVISYVAIVRPRVKSWGFDPEEAELAFPGDDLVSEPSAIDVRNVNALSGRLRREASLPPVRSMCAL